jgi:hypothetical protein
MDLFDRPDLAPPVAGDGQSGFLVRRRKPKAAHVFDGRDTARRRYSTGGLQPENYLVQIHDPKLPICTMRASVPGAREA